MRKAKGVLVVIAGLMALFHAGGTVAVAKVNTTSANGNNGTIKVHDGATEQEPVQANDPHVCTFHLRGLNFDASSSGSWEIDQQAPTGSAVMSSGSWTADSSGDWRTGVMTLPAGHYKAGAKQTVGTTAGGEKRKVFWVECAASISSGGTTGATTGGTTGTTTGTTTDTTNTTGTGAATGPTGGQGNVFGGNAGLPGGGVSGATTTGGVSGPGDADTTAGEVASTGVNPSTIRLPSTSTSSDGAPIAIVGGFLVALGAFLLRRPNDESH